MNQFILELLQDLTGLTFSSFLVLHLTCPIAAAFSKTKNSELIASNLQLANRVIYQDSKKSELLLIWLPLSTHIILAIIRRINKINRRIKIRTQLELKARSAEIHSNSTSFSYPKPHLLQNLSSYLPDTWHSISGYITIPLLIHHIFSHRLTAPPSLRSFQFVTFQLQKSPILNFIHYSTLISFSIYHTLIGIHQIHFKFLNKFYNFKNQNQFNSISILNSERSINLRLTYFAIISTVGLGLYKLSRVHIPPWMAKQYR